MAHPHIYLKRPRANRPSFADGFHWKSALTFKLSKVGRWVLSETPLTGLENRPEPYANWQNMGVSHQLHLLTLQGNANVECHRESPDSPGGPCSHAD